MIRDNRDPVVPHRIPSSPVSLQVLDVPRRVHELEPPGEAQEDEPASVRKRRQTSSRPVKHVEPPDDVSDVDPAP